MLTSSFSAQEKRELYLKAYYDHKNEIDTRISAGIEKNRKGNGHLQFTDSSGKTVIGKKVKIAQKSHDFKYGANIFMLDGFERQEENLEYRRMFKEHFNLATIPFYWDALEPEEGKPRYEADSPKIYRRPAPDLCMEYCETSGISAKLHCLVYEHFVPEWLKKLSKEEVRVKYEERFAQIASRYAGKMMEFEVINELLSYWWGTAISHDKDLLEWSFELARKYFPQETLVLNDGSYLPEIARMDYRHKYYLMIENALLKGLTVNKIGVQNHMMVGVSALNDCEYDVSIKENLPLTELMDYFKALDILSEFGLPIEITEVTIPTLGMSEEDEELQAEMLKLWYSVWFSHEAVDAIVYWNTADGYAHNSADGFIENNVLGGLFHHDLTPKKSAIMLKQLFGEIWHTDLEIMIDENGCVDFRGFYGDYTAEIDGVSYEFGLHKGEDNHKEIIM